MEKLLGHVVIALVIAKLVSAAIQTFKVNSKMFTDKEFSGRAYFFISIVISLIVSFGYTMYYQELSTIDSVAIYAIVVFGAQGFHQTLVAQATEKEVE